jgi:hypothetical protein
MALEPHNNSRPQKLNLFSSPASSIHEIQARAHYDRAATRKFQIASEMHQSNRAPTPALTLKTPAQQNSPQLGVKSPSVTPSNFQYFYSPSLKPRNEDWNQVARQSTLTPTLEAIFTSPTLPSTFNTIETKLPLQFDLPSPMCLKKPALKRYDCSSTDSALAIISAKSLGLMNLDTDASMAFRSSKHAFDRVHRNRQQKLLAKQMNMKLITIEDSAEEDDDDGFPSDRTLSDVDRQSPELLEWSGSDIEDDDGGMSLEEWDSDGNSDDEEEAKCAKSTRGFNTEEELSRLLSKCANESRTEV